MGRLRIAFMGSPAFAVPSLDGLLEAGHEVVLVLAQPDRPAGRGRQSTPPPVAAFARARGLPLFQPPSLKPPEAFERVREAAPDVVVVAAYGLILRREVLDLPPLGCLNVHASLLPRHRGAAPISAAILAGDAATGVCIMRMDVGLDTGPVLARRATPIGPADDTPALTERLALLGRDLLVETLPRWAAGEIAATPQDDALATYAPKIAREDARLNWSRSADELWRQVRAYRGWPDAFTIWQGKQLKVLAAHALRKARPEEAPSPVRRSRETQACHPFDGLRASSERSHHAPAGARPREEHGRPAGYFQDSERASPASPGHPERSERASPASPGHPERSERASPASPCHPERSERASGVEGSHNRVVGPGDPSTPLVPPEFTLSEAERAHNDITGAAPPGHVVLVADGGAQRPAVVTGDGLLVLETVALEGKRPADGADFVRGYRAFVGSDLGT